MRILFFITIFTASVLTGCTIIRSGNSDTTKTQLQIREIQTREFDTNDVKLVMKALLNVLQDDGFVVKNAVTELGLITASMELQISTKTSGKSDLWNDIFESMSKISGQHSTSNTHQTLKFDKFKVVDVSINVSEFGTRTKVRANFQAKILDNDGQPSSIYTIEDPKFYRDFFSRVDKGIFLQKQGL
ncbi:MAG: hypothetical protein HYX66_10035 [Ignavibacteria bacterium]|nr:hypothetical protein [Ignavibacteria bacterium]